MNYSKVGGLPFWKRAATDILKDNNMSIEYGNGIIFVDLLIPGASNGPPYYAASILIYDDSRYIHPSLLELNSVKKVIKST